MNYGYALLKDDGEAPQLDRPDEPDRSYIQLYHYLALSVNLEGLKILDIGCGRGGGLSYLKRYLKVKDPIGLDASTNVLSFCRKNYQAQELAFVAGDAEDLPFPDQSFDAVMNVESSHCYTDIDKFFAGVRRVLCPGGYFFFADFRDKEHLPQLETQVENSGMAVIKKADITDNVFTALVKNHDLRVACIKRSAPKYLTKLFKEFSGCKGTRIYNRFKTGKSAYYSYVLQNPSSKPQSPPRQEEVGTPLSRFLGFL